MESDNIKFQQMQDEMSRFEAEIAGERPVRAVIGSATYGVQQRLQQGGSGSSAAGPLLPPPSAPFLAGNVPPPPPPPSLLLPTQLQRARLPPPPAFPSFPGLPTLPGPYLPLTPPKPQPAVLSGAPQLYRTKSEVEKIRRRRSSPSSLRSIDMPLVRESDHHTSIPMISPSPIIETPIHHPPAPIISSSHKPSKKEKKNRKLIRTAGGQVWEDLSLMDWPDDDFRLFCGDLGNDVTDELLTRTFSKYSSFSRAKVIRDKRTNKSKGFGFISFREPADFIKAMKEMNGRYVGSRPIKLRKSTWRARSLDVVRKKEKEKAALISMLTGGNNKS